MDQLTLESLVTLMKFGQSMDSPVGVWGCAGGQSYCPSKGQGRTGGCKDPFCLFLWSREGLLFSSWAGPASFDHTLHAILTRKTAENQAHVGLREDGETS